MKKKAGLCLLFVACLLLWGCSEANKKQDNANKKEADVIVGVEGENAPYYCVGPDGNASGFYVDLMEILAENGNYSYEFKEIDPVAFQAESENQSCDVFLGTMEKETGDRKTLAQTRPVCQSGVCLVVRSEEGIKKAKELKNTEIAAVASGNEAAFAQYLAVKYEADALLLSDTKTSIDDFISGASKGLVLDYNHCQSQLDALISVNILTISEKYYNFHRFTAKGQTDLLDTLENKIAALQEDGTLDRLCQSYGLQ